MAEPNRPTSENPYASTTLEATTDPVALDGAEGIRRAHIQHEASVKSVGSLYLIGSTFLLLASVGVFFLASSSGGLVAGGVYLSIAMVQAFTGYGLWKLQPWARWVAVLFGALGLLAIPIGTLISAYILYLLLGKKGNMVFSEAYRDIITQTPHVKYKTALITWIVLIVFLALLAVLVVWAFVA